MTKEELEKEAGMEIAEEAYLAVAETREKRIAELEQQIEKMKNCQNCANYMISGKCPRLFRTGRCKNWEMTRSRI